MITENDLLIAIMGIREIVEAENNDRENVIDINIEDCIPHEVVEHNYDRGINEQ